MSWWDGLTFGPDREHLVEEGFQQRVAMEKRKRQRAEEARQAAGQDIGSQLGNFLGQVAAQPQVAAQAQAQQDQAAQADALAAEASAAQQDPYAGLWAMRDRAGYNKDWGAESDAIFQKSIDALNERSGNIKQSGQDTSNQVKALYDYVGSTLPGAQNAVQQTTDESVGKTNTIYNKLQADIGNTGQQVAAQAAKFGGTLDPISLGKLAAGSQPFLDAAKADQATGVKQSTDVGQASQNYLKSMVGNVNAEGGAAATAPLTIAQMKAAELQMRIADVETEKAKARYQLEHDTAKDTMQQMLDWDKMKGGGAQTNFENRLKVKQLELDEKKAEAEAMGKPTGKSAEDMFIQRQIEGFGNPEKAYANEVWAKAIADQGVAAEKGGTDKRTARARALQQLFAQDPTNQQALQGLNQQAIRDWFGRRSEY